MTTSAVLQIENLSFSYHVEPLLNDISLKIQPGDFVSLVGSNGAGKSSLVKLILGELKGFQGSIKLFNEPIRKFSAWKRVGYMPQSTRGDLALFPTQVSEFVGSALFSHASFPCAPIKHKRERVQAALELTNTQDLAKHMLSELSGGQRQRVLLSRALVGEPEFLILDEPTNALDTQSSERLMDCLDSIRKEKNCAIFMITHDLCCIPADCTQSLELAHGSITPFTNTACSTREECTC